MTHETSLHKEIDKISLDIVSKNIATLIKQQRLSQKKFAELTFASEATISYYIRGIKLPGIDFLWTLKQLFGISIDDFLTKELTSVNVTEVSIPGTYEHAELKVYSKFAGTYYVYYFDTSKYKGRDFNSAEDSIMYGVIRIYNDHPASDRLSHSCIAILGIKDRNQVKDIKRTLQSFDDKTELEEMVQYVRRDFEYNAYYGDFTLTANHAFLSMHHENKDKALLILYRTPLNGKQYNGGIGTINSVSRGRESMPTIQFMGLSRHRLQLSPEEIHHNLLLGYPHFKAKNESMELVDSITNLYINKAKHDVLTDEQKIMVVDSILEKCIRTSMNKNVFRYGKISNRDDDQWYHVLKAATMKDEDTIESDE